MILMIDNYDSFTYNIVQYFGELQEDIQVIRNDQITLAEIDALTPKMIVISPGPCSPNEAGMSLEIIEHFAGEIPILGVCLGHQSIAQVFGGKVVRAERLMHGKVSPVFHNDADMNKGMPNPYNATRYHSLIVEKSSLPDCLEVTSWTAEGEIMGLRHKDLAVEGVQFHPESIMTESGLTLLRNFIDQYCGGTK
ncbi:glutamine amidotransferase [Kurthia zopfii]|uniref:Anthranilate synthase component 2/para-aminobenzoate synthetase component 2 n=1 Tax=Kurthia zopfii TaxID=1650 RepID=A0A2U3ABE8_9BACL|nr:aminodeoxychorismate/anthranilate synthase component II [Kurthia zopfii]PWI21873.1 aminodeoxychorismate/anthranilate synthase component II [Kurthia zopfii]TDR36099.1 anthranilate synthase component 2/para-aminobenzoate synthetase component 2 [Kurthia zopfii]STX08437.1 Anthranilate synthase component II [Kurthia zopfii]VEI05315.1 Anthranilate synthase component II [Kurthia zopfii]GEK31010.1 glutamine amidotransferase [Kurthia zopfii]